MRSPWRHYTRMLFIAAWAIAVSWADRGRAASPEGRYSLTDTTVTDTKTRLIWDRNGTKIETSLINANNYCTMLTLNGLVWRLPSMKELQTIVDRTGVSPTIDPEAFPGTPGEAFWTSSEVPASAFVWTVNFLTGYSDMSATMSTNFRVRCVH